MRMNKKDRRTMYWDRTREAKQEFSGRDAMLKDLEPYYFLDYEHPPGYESQEGVEVVEMPWGTNAVDLVVDLLSTAGFTMSVPAFGVEKKHREYAELVEKYVRVVFEESVRVQGQDMNARAAYGGAMRGAVCGRVVHETAWVDTETGEDGKKRKVSKAPGKVPLQVQLRDPLNIWPVFGRDGLSWLVESQERKLRDIRESYGPKVLPDEKDEDKLVEWTEYWDDEWYCYWADGMEVPIGRGVPGPWKHDYGGMPYVYEYCRQTLDLDPSRRTRPLLAGLTGLIERADILDSMEMTFVSNYIGTPWVAKHIGTEKIKMTTRPGSVIHIKDGESIEPLNAGRTPMELQDMQEKLASHFERGTFPSSMYGTDPGRVMAGYAIAMLNQSGQARIQPIIAAMERCFGGLAEKTLMISENFLQKKLFEREIPFFWYMENRDEETDQEFVERQDLKFDATKLEGAYRVEVSIGDIMPADKASDMSLAQAARQPGVTGRPLMSDKTVHEKYHLVESPADEARKIDEELAEAAPEIAGLRRAVAIAKVRKEHIDELDKAGVDVAATLQEIAAGGAITAPLMDMALPQQMPEGSMPQAVGNSMQAVGAGPQMPGMPPTTPTEVGEAAGVVPIEPTPAPMGG